VKKINMEEEKETGAAYMERRRQEIISSTASNIEILNSARLGADDYDFNSVKVLKHGGQSIIF
jgi:serine/threonine protein kinase